MIILYQVLFIYWWNFGLPKSLPYELRRGEKNKKNLLYVCWKFIACVRQSLQFAAW